MSRSQHQKDNGFDIAHGEGHLEAPFLLNPEKHIDEVLVVVHGAGGPPLLVLPESALYQPEVLAVVRLRPPRRAADEAGQPRRREQVAEAEPGGYPVPLGETLQEFVPLLEPVAHDGAHRRVGDERRDPLADVHGLAGLRRGDGGDEAADLVLPDAAERLDAARAEELHHGDLAELPPQRAVGREHQPDAVAHHDADGGAPRPRRERDVVRLGDLPGSVGGRGDDDAKLAEPERHERRVVPARQVGHGAVDERAAHRDLVEVADDRQPPRPRRKPRLAGAITGRLPRHLVEDESEQEESQGEAQVAGDVLHHGHGCELSST
ncbi:Os02g0184800, partial [Oryza sativa Japonica Group]